MKPFSSLLSSVYVILKVNFFNKGDLKIRDNDISNGIFHNMRDVFGGLKI